jgi:cation-transporting ATPase 13A3/4/5
MVRSQITRSLTLKYQMQAPLELGILRGFEFVSQLRRASVIVRQFGDSGASVFVKGAPESVKAICLPESRQYTNAT